MYSLLKVDLEEPFSRLLILELIFTGLSPPGKSDDNRLFIGTCASSSAFFADYYFFRNESFESLRPETEMAAAAA